MATSSSRQEAQAILDRAKELIRAEFGDKVTFGTAKLDEGVSLRVVFDVKLGTAQDQAAVLRSNFLAAAAFLGLEPSDFDLPLMIQGNRAATLVEVNFRSHKAPFIVKTEDGKRWKVGPNTFLAARARSASKAA